MKIFTRLIDIIIITIITSLVLLLVYKHIGFSDKKSDIYTSTKISTEDISSEVENIAKYKEKSILWINSNEKEDSFGTGFVIEHNNSKFVITNYHVVENQKQVTAYLINNKEVSLDVIGYDAGLDIAVLSFNDSVNIPAIKFGSSDKVKIGDFVVAIGHPLGLDYTTTLGIVSAKDRELFLDTQTFEHMIQTDAAINPGNSGGPLFNLDGEVIGMNTAIMEDSQGLGFAIPSSEINGILDDLITKGTVERPFLGVNIIDTKNGIQVVSVYPNSPAEEADIKKDDIILQINDKDVQNIDELTDIINKYKVGDKIKVKIKRKDNVIIKDLPIGIKGENNVING